jgi:hypothetical protein
MPSVRVVGNRREWGATVIFHHKAKSLVYIQVQLTCLKNQKREERDCQSGIPVMHQGNFVINRSEWTKYMNKAFFDQPLYAFFPKSNI